MISRPLLALILLAAFAAPVWAQVPRGPMWDEPGFLPPRPGEDVGLYYVQPTGADWGLVGIWRAEAGLNLGVRLGVLDMVGDRVGFVVGSDVHGPVALQGLPVDLAWTLGAGAVFGGGTRYRIPLGLSVGRVFGAGGMALQPYVHPRVVLDGFASEGRSDTDFGVVVDLGLDLSLTPTLKARFGFSMADGDALGVGVAWRTGRTVVVR